jgi:hypothetical protein
MCVISLLFVPALLAAGPAWAGKGKAEPKDKIQYKSVTGRIKSIDQKKGLLVLTVKSKPEDRDVEFKIYKKIKVFWSKTKMKVTLDDLNPGVRVIIQFYKEKGDSLVAVKVVLPGGMKEAAAAILKGEVKGADSKDPKKKK